MRRDRRFGASAIKPPSNGGAGTAARRRNAADDAPSGAVTLETVAREAGVSPSTVSRIVNGSAVVSAAKVAAVEDAIRRLGFCPDPVARGLAGGRTMSIGVLTQTISSPFYGEALLGVEDELRRVGYVPMFVSGHWVESEERGAIEALLQRRVDGLIVLAGRLSDGALRDYAARAPMVVLGRELSGPRLCSLRFDDRAGAELAVQHLIERGHDRIAFIGGDLAHDDASEREAGYRRALAAARIDIDPALILPGDFTETGGLLAVNRLLDSGVPFTAVFACNDQAAIGAALGLYRRGVRVPDDVSLVGYDDVAPARFAIPPLTTVRQSIYEAGCRAARAMLDLIEQRAPTITLPAPVLTPRESVRRLAR